MTRWALLTLVAMGLLVGGCGSSESSGDAGASENASGIPDASSRPTSEYRERYAEDKVICGAFPEAQVAKEFGVSPGAGPVAIAEAYADAYSGELHQAAFEGCLAGLHP